MMGEDSASGGTAAVIATQTPRLTVFLPVYNEATSISGVLSSFYGEVVRPLRAELLVCEDGSSDGTPEVLRRVATEIPMHLVSSPARKGYGGAMSDGLRLVETPLVFIADSDGQYEPSEFWKIWNAAADYDMVIGRKVRREERFYRSLLSRGFQVLIKAFTGVPLNDMDCGFRLIRREVIAKVLPEVRSLQYSFLAEFSIVAYRKGFRILEVPVVHRARINGSTSIYSWNRLPWIIGHQVIGLLRLARRLNQVRPGAPVDPARFATRG
ncbi:MAG: glycosyltransferase family 2 protein [Thermoplasmata archaeon]